MTKQSGAHDLIAAWDTVAADQPVPLLTRRKIEGANMLCAMINLGKGCVVAVHHHESEQIAYVISGRALWTLGPEREQVEVTGGHVVRLPSHFPHGVEALEDTVILDVLSPVGAMGVDNQKA